MCLFCRAAQGVGFVQRRLPRMHLVLWKMDDETCDRSCIQDNSYRNGKHAEIEGNLHPPQLGYFSKVFPTQAQARTTKRGGILRSRKRSGFGTPKNVKKGKRRGRGRWLRTSFGWPGHRWSGFLLWLIKQLGVFQWTQARWLLITSKKKRPNQPSRGSRSLQEPQP